MNRQPNKINYLYGRLSHEDELAGDSNSIINQRKILTKYPEENGFTPMMNLFNEWFFRKMREHKRRAPRYGNPGLFSGAAYCSDCGEKLYCHTRAVWNKAKTVVRYEGSYSCSRYRKGVQYQEGQACTCHCIREAVFGTACAGRTA